MYLASFALGSGMEIVAWTLYLVDNDEGGHGESIQERALGAKHECTDRGVQEQVAATRPVVTMRQTDHSGLV